MKTPITELLGIQYPIVLPGMSWISTPELVAAVSNAGGLGILATGPLSPDETRLAIRKVRELTNKPFGIGATLMMPGAKENAEVALQEQVPVINFSLGKGDWIKFRYDSLCLYPSILSTHHLKLRLPSPEGRLTCYRITCHSHCSSSNTASE